MNPNFEYSLDDIKKIAEVLCGATIKSKTSDFVFPQELAFTESDLFGICYDLNVDTDFLMDEAPTVSQATTLLSLLAQNDKFQAFLNYLFGEYIDSRIIVLTDKGYDPFLIKSELLTKINSLWSIPNCEFAFGSDNKLAPITVRFKEFSKLGEGGFSSVYDDTTGFVYKVLHQKEKSSPSSVHRFKREYEIMQNHNNSGYTINVCDYEPTNLVYKMEKASTSLEEYIENNDIDEKEKDSIILRCIECMSYLHSHRVIHRDFHPGNIIKNKDNAWVITDFGLAKALSDKYSRATNSTHAVGRFWYTDPLQLVALKDGSYLTDIYSLAKTIDFIFNGDQTQRANKYTVVVNKATAPNNDDRYSNISEFEKDVLDIANRPKYQSPKEVITKLLKTYKESQKIETSELAKVLSNNKESDFIWELIVEFGTGLSDPFVSLSKTNYDLCYSILKSVNEALSTHHPWTEYDIVSYWAASILEKRPNTDDGISSEAAQTIEYVASKVNRFNIMSLSNKLKYDTTIDPHIRALLTYHEGY